MSSTPSRRPEDRWPRDVYSEAVWSSDLPTAQKVVALCFADHSRDGDVTWVEPARLQARTGLGRTAAKDATRQLARAGWLELVERARQQRSPRYRITVPQAVGSRHSEGVGKRQPEEPRVSADGARVSADDPDLYSYLKTNLLTVPEDEDRADPGEQPVLTDPTDHQPHSLAAYADRLRNSDPRLPSYSDRDVQAALSRTRSSLGADEDTARAVLERIVRKCRPSRSLPSYVGRLADSGDLRRFVEDGTSQHRKQTRNELATAISELRKGPECPHGEPGGEALHPEAGTPLCPSCRRLAAVPA